MKRSKVLAALDRARKLEEREREAAALKQNADRLRRLKGGFARSGSVAKDVRAQQQKEMVESKYGPRYDVPDWLPAKADPPPKKAVRKQLTQEMRDREERAKARSAELEARVAPLYNKGPYGYYTDDMHKDLKAGGTRRR